MVEKSPPEPESSNMIFAAIPHRIEILSGMLIVTVSCVALPSLVASFLLACIPIAAYTVGMLSSTRDIDAAESECYKELEGDLLNAREVIAEAEAKKRKAVEGSTADRDRLYRLRGELAALSGSEDRVQFLLPDSGTISTPSDKSKLRKTAVSACRACEERRLVAEEATVAVERLRQRAKDLEAEIEATLQQREAEQASREHLDEEKTKLRAQSSRFHAKITAQDEQLRHARKEVNSYAGYSHADTRRLESELATSLQVKMRQVRSEEQERKQKQGEKRFVESVGERLYETLEERSQQVKDLQIRLKHEASEKQTLSQAIESALEDISKYKTRTQGADESTPKGCDDSGVVQAKAKSSKSAKGKKKKDDEISGNKDLEDLELERASVVAAKEVAEKKSRDMAKLADAKVAQAKKHAEAVEKDCKEIEARLEGIAKTREKIAADQAKISEGLKAHSDKASELESQLKDVERGKIRLRLDIKKLNDAKQQERAAPKSTTSKESKVPSTEGKANTSTVTEVPPAPPPCASKEQEGSQSEAANEDHTEEVGSHLESLKQINSQSDEVASTANADVREHITADDSREDVPVSMSTHVEPAIEDSAHAVEDGVSSRGQGLEDEDGVQNAEESS